jgi:hypothetical protein
VEARRNTLLKELEETREEERAEREEEECAVGELLSTHFVNLHTSFLDASVRCNEFH